MPPRALFRDVPRGKYPIRIELISMATGQVVWETTITEPGAVRVPPVAQEHGPVRSKVTFGDGEVQESHPPEQPPANA